jgi:polyisoprenoid-binding protein YceI
MSTYTIDPVHSIIEFAVKHMTVSTVRGRFLGVEGTVHVEEGAPLDSWVEVRIKAANVDTGVAERDEHLRSADFFNTNRFPQIRYRSRGVEPSAASDGARWLVHGDLTIRGVTRQVDLDATLEGRLVGVDGVERIGFSAECQLNRRDFGINWNGWMGQFLVGDDVKIIMNIEAKKTSST